MVTQPARVIADLTHPQSCGRTADMASAGAEIAVKIICIPPHVVLVGRLSSHIARRQPPAQCMSWNSKVRPSGRLEIAVITAVTPKTTYGLQGIHNSNRGPHTKTLDGSLAIHRGYTRTRGLQRVLKQILGFLFLPSSIAPYVRADKSIINR
jgi:hypothetical protein